MKKITIITLSLIALISFAFVSDYTKSSTSNNTKTNVISSIGKQKQTINMFVTHGHCSTPFSGIVKKLNIVTLKRYDLGNPLEGMKISFEIDPNSFSSCKSVELTDKIKTPGLFINKSNDKIMFNSTNIFTMGLDWYQINGKLSIKGVKRNVKFFVTGIRNPKDTSPSALVLEGQLNLLDWGIDYDLIANGKSASVPSKWLHLNMKIDMI